MIPRTVSLVAEHLLDEAGAGQVPSSCTDNVGPGDNNLNITWGSGNESWITVPEGTGIDFNSPVNTGGAAVVVSETTTTNGGTIGAKLGSAAQKACYHVAMEAVAGHSNGQRAVAVGSASGNTRFSILLRANDIQVRWNSESGSSYNAAYPYNYPQSGIEIFSVYIDTSELDGVDRIKLFIDGERQTADASSLPPLNDACNFLDNNLWYTIGNNEIQARNPVAKIYYVALRNDVDDLGDLPSIVSSLLANVNETPFGDPLPPEDKLLFIGSDEVDAAYVGSVEVDAIYVGLDKVWP